MTSTTKNTKYILQDGAVRLDTLEEIFTHLTAVSRNHPEARFSETAAVIGNGVNGSQQNVRVFKRVASGGESVQMFLALLAEATKRQSVFTIKSRKPQSSSLRQSNLMQLFVDAVDMIRFKGKPEARQDPVGALCRELESAFQIEYSFSDYLGKFLNAEYPKVRHTKEQKSQAIILFSGLGQTEKVRTFLRVVMKMGNESEISQKVAELRMQASKYWVIENPAGSKITDSIRKLEHTAQPSATKLLVYPSDPSKFTPTVRRQELKPTHSYVVTEGTRILSPDSEESLVLAKRREAKKKTDVSVNPDSFIRSTMRTGKTEAERQETREKHEKAIGIISSFLHDKMPAVSKHQFASMNLLQLTNILRSNIAGTPMNEVNRPVYQSLLKELETCDVSMALPSA